jgi:DNA ligase-associated metallophosphoesterase
MTARTVSLLVEGEELLLHPERAVIWPRSRTVIVADTHFGKTSHFGRHGIAVPAGADEADRARLGRLVAETAARRLVILGDFLHAPPSGPEADQLQSWIDTLGKIVDIEVVAGNHDMGASPTRFRALRWREGAWVDPPFRFVHDADRADLSDTSRLFTLSGHVHPVVRLRSMRKSALRVPVFWQKAAGLILPSFGQFTGGFAVRPARGERVHAVGSSGVVSFGDGRGGAA